MIILIALWRKHGVKRWCFFAPLLLCGFEINRTLLWIRVCSLPFLCMEFGWMQNSPLSLFEPVLLCLSLWKSSWDYIFFKIYFLLQFNCKYIEFIGDRVDLEGVFKDKVLALFTVHSGSGPLNPKPQFTLYRLPKQHAKKSQKAD